jgi:RNA polymerase sigma-70 factor (ECF subfamily)
VSAPVPAATGSALPEDWSEGALIRRARAGDHAAFTRLLRRHHERVYAVAHAYLRNAEDALDVTQEVWIKAYQQLAKFREDSGFYTWLYRVAINACIDAVRRRECRVVPLDPKAMAASGEEPADDRLEANPERALEQQERRRMVRECIQALPEPMRLAVTLHDLEGRSQQEVAAIAGWPVGTVKSRLHRARHALRARLDARLSC